jgi:predicted transcriptional regulator
MSETTKTTVYLDDADYRRLKAIARSQGRTSAELVREAVAQYVNARVGTARPTSIGAGRSGRRDLSTRTDELLKGFGST